MRRLLLEDMYKQRVDRFQNAWINTDPELANDEEIKEINIQVKKHLQDMYENSLKHFKEIDKNNKLYKDPNLLTQFIRKLRSLYEKTLINLHNSNSSQQSFLKRLAKKILDFINRCLLKLERLVDDRDSRQMGIRERINRLITYNTYNIKDHDSDFSSSKGKYYIDKDELSPYERVIIGPGL